MARAKKNGQSMSPLLSPWIRKAVVSHAATVRSFFIEGALPGEKLNTRSTATEPSFELGLTTEIYKESPLRVLPKCPYFGVRTAAAAAVPCSTSKRMLRLR